MKTPEFFSDRERNITNPEDVTIERVPTFRVIKHHRVCVRSCFAQICETDTLQEALDVIERLETDDREQGCYIRNSYCVTDDEGRLVE